MIKTFTNTLWKVISVIIIIGAVILFSWYIIKRKKNAGDVFKEATGVITNPAEGSDKTRSGKLKEALSIIWEE